MTPSPTSPETPPAANRPIPISLMEVALPEVIAQNFYMSLGFHAFGLPELMMCNLMPNADSQAVFISAVQQLYTALMDPGSEGRLTKRLLTSADFMPFLIQTFYKGSNGQAMPRVIRSGIRKLASFDATLLLAQLCEYGPINGLLTHDQATGIGTHGVAVMELADESNFLPGQRGYDIRRRSRINTVTVH